MDRFLIARALLQAAKAVLATRLTASLEAEIVKFFAGIGYRVDDVRQYGSEISVYWTEKAYGTQFSGTAEMRKYRFVTDEYEYYNENAEGPRRMMYGQDNFSSVKKQKIIDFCKQHRIPNLTIHWGTD